MKIEAPHTVDDTNAASPDRYYTAITAKVSVQLCQVMQEFYHQQSANLAWPLNTLNGGGGVGHGRHRKGVP